MDLSIINRFREQVNSNGFTYFWYRTRSELNHWNCICSAMDWITVAVEHIDSITEEKAKNMRSIDVFAYISSVDLIVESVQQLHRVVNKTTDLLFKDDAEVFAGNQFNQNDLRYFKTLRSCFGAHPVNLAEPGDMHRKEMRRFASWSCNTWGNGTASVILYSNQHKEEHIFLSIDLQQILRFGLKYYNHLEFLEKCLETQYEEFVAIKRAETISAPTDPVEHLETLLHASKERLDNALYRSYIQELKLLLTTKITNAANADLVAAYRDDLRLLIDELHDHLQNMELTDFEYDYLLNPLPKGMPNGWGYWYEKLSEYVFSGGYPPMIWEQEIIKLFEPYVRLEYSSYEELFLLVQAALHRLQKRDAD